MLKILINTESDDWIDNLYSNKYFMRNKNKKNDKLFNTMKKVGRLNAIVSQVLKEEKRTQSRKHQRIDSYLYYFFTEYFINKFN